MANVLTDIRGVRFPRHDLAKLCDTTFPNEDCLTREQVCNATEAELSKGDRLGCHHIVRGTLEGRRRSRTNTKGSDAICVTLRVRLSVHPDEVENSIPEAKDTEAGNHGNTRESAVASCIDLAQGNEDVTDVRTRLVKLVQCVSPHIEQKLRIRVSVDVAASVAIEEGDEVFRVHKVAIDTHRQAKWRVHVEGLRFRSDSHS
jgi:hypothetical protein